MDQKTISNKQRHIMIALGDACENYERNESWIRHFDEAVRIQSEIGRPYLSSDRYAKIKDLVQLLGDKPKCHGPNELAKITHRSIDERHDFIFYDARCLWQVQAHL